MPARVLPLLLLCAACRTAPPPGESEFSQLMEDFSMTQSEGGRAAWELSAPRAELALDGAASLKEPRFTFYSRGARASTAEARRATLSEGRKRMLLSGDVLIRSLQEEATLETPSLEYDAAKSLFQTEEAVTLRRPGLLMTGRGMTADASLSEIRIRNQSSRILK